MDFDLAAWLPLLTPKAIDWAERRASEVLTSGVPLAEQGLALARRVGVACPEKIRISFVARMPVPGNPLLRRIALQAGFLGPNTAGLTLGHAIYIRAPQKNSPGSSVGAHPVRESTLRWNYAIRAQGALLQNFGLFEIPVNNGHEEAGSIAAYLPKYLQQIAQFGYAAAPYEVDARAHETDV